MSRIPLVLLLNNVRSLHNVGSIFRSSDGVGIEKIFLQGLTPQPPRLEISKTALGATETVKWEYTTNWHELIQKYRQTGYQIVALEQSTESKNIFEFRGQFPMLLVLGNEREGVENDILKMCDFILEIPMYGQSAHSLNVCNAASIALYDFRNKWEQQKHANKISTFS